VTGLGFATAHAGFVCLCLAMQRHHEQALGHRRIPPPLRRRLAGGGWLLLAASLALLVHAAGWGLGLVIWTGLLTAAALPVVVLLTYRPRWVMPVAALAVLGGAVSLVAG
jgi:hypothetical protein